MSSSVELFACKRFTFYGYLLVLSKVIIYLTHIIPSQGKFVVSEIPTASAIGLCASLNAPFSVKLYKHTCSDCVIYNVDITPVAKNSCSPANVCCAYAVSFMFGFQQDVQNCFFQVKLPHAGVLLRTNSAHLSPPSTALWLLRCNQD